MSVKLTSRLAADGGFRPASRECGAVSKENRQAASSLLALVVKSNAEFLEIISARRIYAFN